MGEPPAVPTRFHTTLFVLTAPKATTAVCQRIGLRSARRVVGRRELDTHERLVSECRRHRLASESVHFCFAPRSRFTGPHRGPVDGISASASRRRTCASSQLCRCSPNSASARAGIPSRYRSSHAWALSSQRHPGFPQNESRPGFPSCVPASLCESSRSRQPLGLVSGPRPHYKQPGSHRVGSGVSKLLTWRSRRAAGPSPTSSYHRSK
jgi:hypothetical protein